MTKFKYDTKAGGKSTDGEQYIFHFENGFGASVIRKRGSYGFEQGLWELAVLWEGHLCYSTPITDDVIGHLSNEEVNDILDQIKELEGGYDNE